MVQQKQPVNYEVVLFKYVIRSREKINPSHISWHQLYETCVDNSKHVDNSSANADMSSDHRAILYSDVSLPVLNE